MVHLPARPRLADHVAARRHRVGSADFVTLHDEQSGRVAQVGLREWAVMGCLDGTRDLEGVAAATGVWGQPMTAEQLLPFLEALAQAGMLADGVAPRERAAARPEPDLPIEALPFALSCDGSGGCCRMYLTVPLSPDEAARASAFVPEGLEVPFTPERAATLGPGVARALTMIDGRCSFLDGSRCRLHAARIKPHGCTMFPAQLIDDGRSVRVAPAPECGCVFDSAGRQDGAPLLPAEQARRSALDPRTFVARLGDPIAVTADTTWARARFLDWSDALAGSVGRRDAPRSLWWLAGALQDGTAPRDIGEPGPIDRARLDAEAAALRALVAKRLALHAYRAAGDLAYAVPQWMHAVLAAPLADEPRDDPAEAFYWRALWHVHAFASDAPIASALRRRALRLLVARALPEAMARAPLGRDDSALRHPLALVEAYCRAYGV